ncbi:MAG: sulfatase-like hydrolase/transferase [Pirellulales bacterium]
MLRFASVILVSILALSVVTFAAAPTSTERPNIVLIFPDDVGLGEIHCTGGPFNTPNIDRMAAGGMIFTYNYATPLCGPSRCQLLTGRYPFRTGHSSNSKRSKNAIQPSREVLIPSVLKKVGYVTASVGKWGQICLGPGEWGFDEYITYEGSGIYWRHQKKVYEVNGEQYELPEGKYLPDVMHDFAADFIARHKDQRFFLYYPMTHLHEPILPTPHSKVGADTNQLYADNIEYMDFLVGRLLDELDRQHLREKTLIIFAGDNGSDPFYRNPNAKASTVNGKLVYGEKRQMLEGGSRVPMIVNWPGVTPAGTVNNDLTDFSDFFVTFADLAGAPLPDGVKLDGHSFASQFRGKKGHPRDWVYVEFNGKSYVRDARYKLTGDGEMFDMSEAPFYEIAVAKDTTDPAANSSRKALQAVLDNHKALPRDAPERPAHPRK